jgi:SAM-dependent methyltransferase
MSVASVGLSVTCIACKSPSTICVGPLTAYTESFLGMSLEDYGTLGFLYRCHDCKLRFRAPAPTDDALMRYYSRVSAEQLWKYEPDRDVWRSAVRILQRCPERSILDIGCFRGDFLGYLGNEWSRFGVEPSHDAQKEANRRGVTIIANSIETLGVGECRFGAITMFDVIEHLARPLEALQKLMKLLLPSGQLVIFTGNSEALSWRISGLRYWYSALPEHIAFFSPSWFRWAAPKLSCSLGKIHRLPHRRATSLTRLDETLKNLAYITYHRIETVPGFATLLPRIPLIRRIGNWNSCWWTSANDHMLVQLIKQESA